MALIESRGIRVGHLGVCRSSLPVTVSVTVLDSDLPLFWPSRLASAFVAAGAAAAI